MFSRTTRCLGAMGLPAFWLAVSVLTGGTLLDPLPSFTCACPPASADVRPTLGSRYNDSSDKITFNVFSFRATRIDVYLYAQRLNADEKMSISLTKDAKTHVWSATVTVKELEDKGIGKDVFYGYRAWGPNWPFDSKWVKGSNAGFISDVDADGNRFNPNRLLLDPYALEVSNDPRNETNMEGSIFASGSGNRDRDSGQLAPKGIVLRPDTTDVGTKPTRPFKDEIIYEVHLRGLTMQDDSIDKEERGTYAGAAKKAAYLKEIGVTAIELLPVHEFDNDQNDVEPESTEGDNFWGYNTLSFFAPDRRYAKDKSPGGPTREFKTMVKAFHDAGIRVYLDVVYNHTGEGGLHGDDVNRATILSWRGLDNATYYQLADDARFYYDQGGRGSGGSSGVGPNLNVACDVVRDHIIDSLRHWADNMGVDGFRFDLAPILANKFKRSGFQFDPGDAKGVLRRAVDELPVREAEGGKGVDLIAEPWGGNYSLGGFPKGWAEWSDHYRDTFRRVQNKLGIGGFEVTPGRLAARFAGSSDKFNHSGRKPWASVNFIVAHDGVTLRDLHARNQRNNNQPWPFGPSDGGRTADEEMLWDQGGERGLQRQAARTGLAILMLSAGVPMITGGDEMYRTQFGNNNVYNLDSPKSWLNWEDRTSHANFHAFARRIMRFRNAHPALRRAEFFTGSDHNDNGVKDITWYRSNGNEPDAGYFDDPNQHFLAFRLDGTEVDDPSAAIYVAYNGWREPVEITLPRNQKGKRWFRVADTAAWMEDQGNAEEPGAEEVLADRNYRMHARSVLLLIER